MKIKSVTQTAAVAWSPGTHPPILATGTAAGALDSSFDSGTVLELYDLNLSSKSSEMKRVASLPVNARFNRLAWSIVPGDASKPMGVITGGLDNGEIGFWNAKALIQGLPEAQLLKQKRHNGAVRGLDFNPTQTNLLASGASDGELFIWDLNNLSKPFSPGSKSPKLEDVTCLQWNKQVAHILATASNNGYTVIWDLKNKKAISHIGYPYGRKPITSVAWHPDAPLQIATTADDDSNPAILIWDLRNATAPLQSLNGHSKSILSIAWCSKDSDLMLSCGKDNRTVVWNVPSMSPIGDLHVTANWAFETKWCDRNPDLAVVASFDGKVTVHSLQGAGEPLQEEPVMEQQANVPYDAFSAAIMQGMKQADAHAQAMEFKLTAPPKWFGKSSGVAWGPGNRLASFGKTEKTVILRTIVPEPQFTSRAEQLKNVIYQDDVNTYMAFAQQRASDEELVNSHEKEVWGFLQFLFGGTRINDALGYMKSGLQLPTHADPNKTANNMDLKFAAMMSKLKLADMKLGEPAKPSINLSVPAQSASRRASAINSPQTVNGLFDGSKSPNFDLDPMLSEPADQSVDGTQDQPAGPTPLPKFTSPLKLYTAARINNEEADVDAMITRYLISGDFEAAVKLCFATNRMADGLAIATSGGADLLLKAQREYFLRSGEKKHYARVLQDIVTSDIADIVEHTDLDEDGAAWKDVLTFIYTYADPEEAFRLLRVLAERLEGLAAKVKPTDPPSIKSKRVTQKYGAIMAYMGAGETERVVKLWLPKPVNPFTVAQPTTTSPAAPAAESDAPKEIASAPGSPRKKNASSSYAAFAMHLQAAMEKISIYRKASNFMDQELYLTEPLESYQLQQLYDQYVDYAALLTEQGVVDFAWYVTQLVPDLCLCKTIKGETSDYIKHRIYMSGKVASSQVAVEPRLPFEPVEVFDGSVLQDQTYASYDQTNQNPYAQYQQPQQVQQQQWNQTAPAMGGVMNTGYNQTQVANNFYSGLGQQQTMQQGSQYDMYQNAYGNTQTMNSGNVYGSGYRAPLSNRTSFSGQGMSAPAAPPAVAAPPQGPPQGMSFTQPTLPQFLGAPPAGGMPSAQANGSWTNTQNRIPTPSVPPPPTGPSAAAPLMKASRRRSSANSPHNSVVAAPPSGTGMFGSSNMSGLAASANMQNMPSPLTYGKPEEPLPPPDVKASIPPAQRPLADLLDKLVKQYDQMPHIGLSEKKMLEEVGLRLAVLFKQMASGGLRQDVFDKLGELLKAIGRGDYATAHKIQVELMTTKFDVTGQWIVGIKRLLDVAERCQPAKSLPAASPISGPAPIPARKSSVSGGMMSPPPNMYAPTMNMPPASQMPPPPMGGYMQSNAPQTARPLAPPMGSAMAPPAGPPMTSAPSMAPPMASAPPMGSMPPMGPAKFPPPPMQSASPAGPPMNSFAPSAPAQPAGPPMGMSMNRPPSVSAQPAPPLPPKTAPPMTSGPPMGAPPTGYGMAPQPADPTPGMSNTPAPPAGNYGMPKTPAPPTGNYGAPPAGLGFNMAPSNMSAPPQGGAPPMGMYGNMNTQQAPAIRPTGPPMGYPNMQRPPM